MTKYTKSKIPLNKFKEEEKAILKTEGCFNEEIYTRLPNLLKDGCDILQEATEKEVFLIGGLAVASGLIPNVSGFYDGRTVYPHLYCYVLANYGVGKGALQFARKLGQSIHKEKLDEYRAYKELYDEEIANLKKGDTPPIEPNQSMLYIPANNSKSGFLELLHNNNDNGIIFETEGDTIANAMKQEHGNYSDILRKAFHHESIAFYRRTGKEFIDIENPKLAAVLSSTPDQMKGLIPTIENGLFSRFLYYTLQGNNDFRNVFDKSKSAYPEAFGRISDRFKTLYNNLFGRESDIEILLTESQENQFLKVFREWKKECRKHLQDDLTGTVNRLGLICFRICIIFTILRESEKRDFAVNEKIFCNDLDFQNAIEIVGILKTNALEVYFKMPKPASSKNQTHSKDKSILKKRAIELKSQGMSWGEISLILRVSKSTIRGWVNKKG